MQEVVIVQACRTAFGRFGGALRNESPIDLASTLLTAVLEKSGVKGADVQHVVMGHVVATAPDDVYLPRWASMRAGVSHKAPAMTVNRLCGSGMQAIIAAAQGITLGEGPIALAGGVESVSRIPHLVSVQRWEVPTEKAALVDMLNDIFIQPFDHRHVGVTGDTVARRYGISRADQDELALESHRRAHRAIEQGHFRTQLVPVSVKTERGERLFDRDECVRADISLAKLASLEPAFDPEGGSVTAGNTLALADGAAAVLLMSAEQARQHGLTPLARVVSWGHAGVEPHLAGMGPVPATQIALRRAGLSVSDLDVIELNESFAAQVCAVMLELKLDPVNVNPNGSGISLGHPFGATGAALVVKTVHELVRTQGRYGLATMCLAGGQGIAMVLERS
ncbi:acetyl-CoA C-acyltransferase [Alcaligenes sp. 13f]|uniref:acetyl-CoA C-acyltransferase n=1 Tax=Alcaligenes sp. 13f TaxID=2841924 RepID=UPI001CF66D71|nr:acetyl-CoA C-acyltransferase [Alcaligenes sp. 13f]MCB4323223.1 acetyl-CoA C-acyltransferase [Alcaligenes sp. 13f]